MAFNPEIYAPADDWYDTAFVDAKEAGALMGFDIEDIHFTGFGNQGDGASFDGELSYVRDCAAAVRGYAPLDTELHDIADRWQALQDANHGAITGKVESGTGRYSHSNSALITLSDSRHEDMETFEDFDESAAARIVRDFMDWIYRQLEADYEYQCAWQIAYAWQEKTGEVKKLMADFDGIAESLSSDGLPEKVALMLEKLRERLVADSRELSSDCSELADNFHYWREGKAVPIAEFAAANL